MSKTAIYALAARLLRKSYAGAAIVCAAAVVLMVNEVTYRRSERLLSAGIELTDARIATASVLQLLTDAETSQRGYVLTQEASFLQPYRQALAAIPPLRRDLHRYFAASGADDDALAEEADRVIEARLNALEAGIKLAQSGERSAAIELIGSGAGRNTMDRLRGILSAQLSHAGRSTDRARLSIYDALQLNRIATAFLTLLAVVGLLAFLRQLRARDRERALREESLETLVRTRTRELRHLARHLQTVREDERGVLAREIHDELGGLLTAAKLDLARVRVKVVHDDMLLARLEHAIGLLNEGIAFKRKVIEDLRPSSLSILGVRVAILTLCDEAAVSMAIPVRATLEDLRLSPPDDLVCYRFVQEALTNIAKYAEAKNVYVNLSEGIHGVEVKVRDDGVGFIKEVALIGRHGLNGMRFRVESLGGKMTVDTAPGLGTTVGALLPGTAGADTQAMPLMETPQ
ncbi:MAG: hypothetical protein JWQ73_870 [Variovorax sp.]|nr:hypothetical protein [Variovorax sp.]